MKFLQKIVVLLVFVILLVLPSTISAQTKIFSAEELLQFDGRDGRKAYYAYEGKVYDVTGSKLWKEGEHFGLQAGQDLTGKMDGAPHGTDVFAGFAVVGTYGVAEAVKTNDSPSVVVTPTPAPSVSKVWYEGRIRVLGISLLGWTGIGLGILFVFTFFTCFAMPWAKMNLPWKGSKLGPDPLDSAGTHLPFSSMHKYFVWWTVIFGIIHGVLGFLQLVGVYL